MKKFLLILLAIVIFFAFTSYRNSNPKGIISGLTKKGPIQEGELKYRIYLFGILPIGDAILTKGKPGNYEGREVYHLSASVESSKTLSFLFKGSAAVDSYVDAGLSCPVLFRQKLSIAGKPDAVKEVFYDQANLVMTIADKQRSILANTQDPLSAVFNIRKMDFSQVKDIEMNINTNQKNYLLKGPVTNESLDVNKKLYKIARATVEIRRREKNPHHKSRVTMFFLQDAGNIPVLIRVFASGVLINAKLIEIR
ncbi:MAG: DUF3108 domain-containing protein [Candidatus Omnitrophica bacterium]|nr:DUF3108 domain-containing protein [Candidatus Omnitrophota bacterium]